MDLCFYGRTLCEYSGHLKYIYCNGHQVYIIPSCYIGTTYKDPNGTYFFGGILSENMPCS